MQTVEEVAQERPTEAPVRRRGPADLWAALSYAVLSVLVMSQLWRDPNGRMLAGNKDDHNIFLFMIAHAERVVFAGENPFHSSRLNVPDGVNMMANTAVLALGLPLAPVSHCLGVGVTVVLLITLGLAGTAFAWYWVLSRHLVTSKVAAWIGGLWCGFCPAMISHANGHVNFVSQWVIPFIVWQALRLREPGRAVRGGIILGLLIVLQVFINEESLLFTALALGVFVVAYGLMAWSRAKRDAPHMVKGLGVAALVSGGLLAYPLWYQFFAPGHYHGQPFEPDHYATDLASLGFFARQSLAGYGEITRKMSVSATEDNTFFGPAGLLMIIISVVVLWRSVAARAAAVAAFVLLVMSLGPELVFYGHRTGVPLPFGLISHAPVIDLVSVTRFAIVTSTIAGVLLALAADRARAFSPGKRRLFQVGLVLALVPLFPKPAPVVQGDPLPPFLTQGTWKQYVTGNRTLVTVPLPEVTTGRAGQRWATLNHFEYPTPRGYFMGPADPPANDTGSWNAPRRFTSDLLYSVREYGIRPRLTATDRARITADLIFWRAAVVVLVPNSRNGDDLQATLTDALGPPQEVGGVEIWDVRYLAVPS
ncbi:hypothetical protein AB0J83_35295 [Actinoplanes sp. NPDC049596]|uniref:hypothetical protein n=1 Tax=unclassified Actinoplanes TaxID=2626549 RepID=UPI00344006E0